MSIERDLKMFGFDIDEVRRALAATAPDKVEAGPVAADIVALITEACNAAYDCGEWDDDDNPDDLHSLVEKSRRAREKLIAAISAMTPVQPTTAPNTELPPLPEPDCELGAVKHACWLLMQHSIHRYLMSNAHGRWNGAEKAMRHLELCKMYVAVICGGEIEDALPMHEDDFLAVHSKTQELTGSMDEAIGFPLESMPDYDALAPLFFEKFMDLARAAIAQKEST